MLDIGLLHHLEELAGIGAQALDIAPLALGVDRIEGQARLARARQAGDDNQLLARQGDVKPLEVMLPRAADGNVGETHGCGLFHTCSRQSSGRQALFAARALPWFAPACT